MDKRSDSVRCRRALNTASRLDHSAAPPGSGAGLKEDKIRFLLEAAEAARGAGAGTAPRGPTPGFGAGMSGGMSLGQYVSALSSCLPGGTPAGGASGGGIRPLLWSPISQAAAAAALQQAGLPHDGLTSHAALLSSLAAAPVQNTTSTLPPASQPVPDGSILNSLLASYATGAPLFSVNGLSGGSVAVPVSTSSATPPPQQLPPPPPPLPSSSEAQAAVPQDLSMSAAAVRDAASESSRSAADMSFLSKPAIGSPARAGGYPANGSLGSHHRGRAGTEATTRPRVTTDGGDAWASAAVKPEDHEAEQATDLSVRGAAAGETSSEERRYHQSVPDVFAAVGGGGGTVDLSTRVSPRKPRHLIDITRDLVDRSGHSRPGSDLSRPGGQDFTTKDLVDSKRAVDGGCCGDAGGTASCPHLTKLRELRRNVYKMLSVFTPYLDVSGAGISDSVDDDTVDDFLHEVIYSSKLDQ